MTPEDLRAAAGALVERTRTAQGLPRHIEDPDTLRRVAQVVAPRRGTARPPQSDRSSSSTRHASTPGKAGSG